MLKKKRITAIVAAMMMAVTMLPGAAFAADDEMDILIDVNGGETTFDIAPGDELDLTAEVEAVSMDGEENDDYHVHWAKMEGKKRVNFIEQGQESAVDMVAGNSAKVKGVTAGTVAVTVSVVSGRDHAACSGTVLESEELTINVKGGEENDPYAYGPQGKDVAKQSVQMIEPKNITQVYPAKDGDEPTEYVNKINKQFRDDEELEFTFVMGKEMGNQFDEESFKQNTVSKITLQDTKGAVVASQEKGNLVYTDYNELDRSTAIFIEEQLPAGNYTLVFDKDIYVNNAENTLGVPVKFNLEVISTAIPVKSIKLSAASLTLKQGAAKTLKATVSPADADDTTVIWKSSNTKVAAVSTNGKVTAKGGGTATITARSDDGTNVTAKCTVTVVGNVKLSLSSKKGTVTAKWTKSAGSKYQIQRSTKKNSGFKTIATTSKNSYADKKVKKGKTYYYKVRAMKAVKGSTVYGNFTKPAKVKVK